MNRMFPMATPSPAGRSRSSSGKTPPRSVRSADREQAMKDYKLSIEYKHLKSHCPGGVYLIPSMDQRRLFHGVIFCRRGLFTNAVFKFTLQCSSAYNDVQQHPVVKFTSYVYNPHVDEETGELDLKNGYPQWNPNQCFLVTVLTYIKRIFYVKDYNKLSDEERAQLPNQAALNLFLNDKEAYRRRVGHCVTESQKSIYMNSPDSAIKFQNDEPHLDLLRGALKHKFGATEDSDTDPEELPSVVTKEGVLDCVREAQRAHARATMNS